MAKNKNKNKKKKVLKRKKKSNVIPFAGSKDVKRVTLKKKLDSIYENNANLETTCEGICECCKVAMPQMNYCEFVQMLSEAWSRENKEAKIALICKSIEYFFRTEFEKWNIDSLIKPCMLLDENCKCKYYESRPLNCRLYGLWPDEIYERRVSKFAKAYDGLLKREEIPLNKQCPHVKRVDESVELTEELLEKMFAQLDNIDFRMKKFTPTQIENKENYRTFHDWLLWTFFGEDWLMTMSTFVMQATREVMEDQMKAFVQVLMEKFANETDIDIDIAPDIEESDSEDQ